MSLWLHLYHFVVKVAEPHQYSFGVYNGVMAIHPSTRLTSHFFTILVFPLQNALKKPKHILNLTTVLLRSNSICL